MLFDRESWIVTFKTPAHQSSVVRSNLLSLVKNCVEQEIQIDRRRNAITHLRELASSLQTKLPDIDPTRAESPFAVSKVKIPQANKPVVKTHRPDLR